MKEFSEKNTPHPSIMIFSLFIGLMQLGALATHLSEGRYTIGIAINVILLVACWGLWTLRKWAVWVMIGGLLAISLVRVYHTDEPMRNFIFTALPMVLIAVACTVPHYKNMR